MSGLEVVGVVLGALPVAVKALKAYMSVLSSMKHAQRNLKALVRDLETEQLRLQTTCELLLDGIAPPSAIDKLIQTPFGPEWKPYNDRLRLRLWTTSGKFEGQVAELQSATDELKAKLCLGPDGSAKLTDRLAISRELKRGASFSLKRKDYDEILTKIKTANSVLHELAGQNCSLEPTRRHRSQVRLIRLIRGLARGIFNALLYSLLPCSCVKPHDVCLELEAREAILVPTDLDDEVAKNFSFHMVMSSHSDPPVANRLQNVRWESIYVKAADSEAIRPRPTSAASSTPSSVTTSSSRKPSRRITWARSLSEKLSGTQISQTFPTSQTFVSTSSTQTLVEMTRNLTILPESSPQAYTATKVSNLCQTVFKSSKTKAVDPYGYIADRERMFELHPPQTQPDFRLAVTLRDLLSEKSAKLTPFDYPQKLKVAVSLSVSILHLFSTPWLSNVVTLDDVRFFHVDNTQASGSGSELTYQPFIIRPLHQKPAQYPRTATLNAPRPVNLAVLSLGALLIQLIIGRAVDELDMTGTMDMLTIISKHEAGNKLSGEVLENGGIHYASAVKWCLSSVLEVAGLENDNFCQRFYGAVVAKLEDDAKLTAGG